jgi:uncharacterized protein (TIGR02996 family)
MTPDDAFLQDIVAHPDDDTPRLIYADWLDEHGQSARAEFIRVQCELASLPEEDDRRWPLLSRERALLAVHEEDWSCVLDPFLRDQPSSVNWFARIRNYFRSRTEVPRAYSGSFRRGFLQQLTLNDTLLLPRADAYAVLFPLESLILPVAENWQVIEEGIARCEQLKHVQRLDAFWYVQSGYASVGMARLAQQLPGLQHLRLDTGEQNICEALLKSQLLQRLRSLELHDPQLASPRELAALLSRLDTSSLRTLRLPGGAIGPTGANYLSTSPALSQLTELDLVGNEITDAGATTLLASPLSQNLHKVYLGRNALSREMIRAIFEKKPALQNLTHLDLSGNPLEDVGARALATASTLRKLRFLNLSGCALGANGLAVLTRSSNLAELRTLLLSSFVGHERRTNWLGDFGAATLARTSCLTKLTRLELRHTGVGANGVEALCSSEAMSNLRVLDLTGNDIGDRGVRALVQSKYLGKLQQLRVDLKSNRIGAWARRAIRSRFRDVLQ